MTSASVHEAVATIWADSGLETLFESYWDAADRDSYLSLNDGEAAPGTPFPYVVFESPKPEVTARMSAANRKKRIIRSHIWTFQIFAKQTDSKSAKELASELAAEILKIFGGDPLQEPLSDAMSLDDGNIINIKYLSDYGVRVEHDIYQWTVEYEIVTDIPIMV